ncbi:MAG: DUF3137 domain-containing protein [Bacilli bacterium]|nr:DUF3137 domain-containing protein [Bacilli bacterium]
MEEKKEQEGSVTREMEQHINELETLRQQMRKKWIIRFSIGIPLAIAGLVMMIIVMTLIEQANTLGLVLVTIALAMMIVGVVFIVLGSKARSKFSKTLMSLVRNSVHKNLWPDARYDNNAGFSWQMFNKPHFFEEPDRYTSKDWMDAVYDGIQFQSASYNLERRETHTDSKGHTHTEYVSYAKGTMYRFDFEREFGATVKVIEGKRLFAFTGTGLEKVQTEWIEFNKKFVTYTSDINMVFYILTPQIQEKIMELEGKFKGQFYMAFLDSELFICVNDDHASLKIPYNQPITIDTLKPVIEFVAIPAVFIKLLGLNKNKFKKNAGVE